MSEKTKGLLLVVALVMLAGLAITDRFWMGVWTGVVGVYVVVFGLDEYRKNRRR